MKNKLKISSYQLVIAFLGIFCLCGVAMAFSGMAKMVCEDGANCTFQEAVEEGLRGLNHNVQEDFAEGISVDGTERIDGSGNFTPATLTSAGALTVTSGGATITAGGLTVTAGGATITDGNLAISSGVQTLSGETATSTLVEDILTFTRKSGTGYGTDGIGSGLLFKAYDSAGNATNTARMSVVSDDVTQGSDETSIIFEQLLDNGIALSNVFELDSGDAIFNTNDLFVDYSTNRVGIQNASPTKTLDVTGTFGVSGESLFAGNVVLGGATTTISATTSAGDLLLTAAQLCDGGNEIELEASIDAGAFTVTLPTAALLAADCFSTNGSKTIWIDNNSGDNATITAGSGGDLLEGDGLNVVIGTGNQASIEIQLHTNGTAYRAAATEWQDAD